MSNNKRFHATKRTEKDLDSIYAQDFLVIQVDDYTEIKLSAKDTDDLIALLQQGCNELGWYTVTEIKEDEIETIAAEYARHIPDTSRWFVPNSVRKPDHLARLIVYIKSRIYHINETKTSFATRDSKVHADLKIETYQDVLGMIKDFQESEADG